ncbi:MAG: hypothetical protein ACHQ1H_01155, partial [Nitrososphaerales archaeon]
TICPAGRMEGDDRVFGDRFVPKTNRLYRKLVEGKIATEVNTYFPVSIDPTLLYFDLTLSPRVAMNKAKEELYSELAGAADTPASEDEMRVVSNQIKSWHAYENDGISLQALSIGFMQVIRNMKLGDTLVDEALKVTPEDVQRVARLYLSEKRRVSCEFRAS